MAYKCETYKTLLYKFTDGKWAYFGETLQQSVASNKFQSQSRSDQIFSYVINIWLSFIDTATSTIGKVTKLLCKTKFDRLNILKDPQMILTKFWPFFTVNTRC